MKCPTSVVVDYFYYSEKHWSYHGPDGLASVPQHLGRRIVLHSFWDHSGGLPDLRVPVHLYSLKNSDAFGQAFYGAKKEGHESLVAK